ncbi:gamma-glutamyltransferase [Rhodobacterales bacterium HKCCE3408]|nr:gamma-glutamyltransferase [Rhodobacterales bacterium HKCCE3408]
MRDFHLPGRSAVFARNGMVATSHPLAVKTGVAVLEAGGNAVDAAIATAILLGQCEPQMTGLGGDMFALIRKPGQDIIGLNASGRAPAALSAKALRDEGLKTIPPSHPAAITLPGAVDGFCRLHADHGRLPLADILAPAIRYAEDGIPVAPRVGFDWSESAGNLQASGAKHYLSGGAAPSVGATFRAPAQAEVLRRIAAEGRAGFYEGEVAADMLAALKAIGGTHTAKDFASVACDYVTPVSGTYRGYRLTELPPNGQGATAILLANILSHFDLASLDPFGATRAHLEAEATKLAYDARNRFVSDADYMTRLDHMLAPETAEALAGLIADDRVLPDAAAITEAVHRDTVILTVVDSDRMAVSMIYSIFASFGSGHASDRFGILFHNRGGGFTLTEGHPNEAGPGKRPMHTIIPAMLEEPDGSFMPFGVMGGQYQAAGHARFLSNVADFGMAPQMAIDAPRSFAITGDLQLERGYGPDVRAELADLGHRVVTPETPIGGAQAVRIDASTDVLQGASDPRKDGCALGY